MWKLSSKVGIVFLNFIFTFKIWWNSFVGRRKEEGGTVFTKVLGISRQLQRVSYRNSSQLFLLLLLLLLSVFVQGWVVEFCSRAKRHFSFLVAVVVQANKTALMFQYWDILLAIESGPYKRPSKTRFNTICKWKVLSGLQSQQRLFLFTLPLLVRFITRFELVYLLIFSALFIVTVAS